MPIPDRPCLRTGLAVARDEHSAGYVYLFDQLRLSDRRARLSLLELSWAQLLDGRRTLAEIQAELLGATDATLRHVAQVPEAALDGSPAPPPAPQRNSVNLLSGVPLDRGAVLLLPTAPEPGDVAAIRSAARPLLDLLADRGLLTEADRGLLTEGADE